MIGIMVFNATWQFISKQRFYVLLHDFQSRCMSYISLFHIKTCHYWVYGTVMGTVIGGKKAYSCLPISQPQ
jgi:cytochrome b subunit of formate dehydrogenase